jgi:predicted hydrolase (HD superfamily)
MRDQARRRGADEELWGLTGSLHDLDYEWFPDLETGHPRHAHGAEALGVELDELIAQVVEALTARVGELGLAEPAPG